MTTSDLQMAHDRVSCDTKSTGEASYGSTTVVCHLQGEQVGCGELRHEASPLIHALCDRFDVFGVHARSDAAQMIGLEVTWPGANSFFPDSSVRNCLPSPEDDLAVAAISYDCPLPYPTWSIEAAILNSEVPLVDKTDPMALWALLPSIEDSAVPTYEPLGLPFDVSVTAVGSRSNWRGQSTATFAELQCHKDTAYQLDREYPHPARRLHRSPRFVTTL